MKYEKKFQLKCGAECLIRNAVAEDAEVVTSIGNQLYFDTPYLSCCPEDELNDVKGIKSYICDLLPAEREAFLVVELDGEIIGDGQLDSCGSRVRMRHRSDVSLGIRKQNWNMGIGTCLMKALLECAETAGYEQVELNVMEGNEYAIKLYENMGFQTTGRGLHAVKFADGTYRDWIEMIKFL